MSYMSNLDIIANNIIANITDELKDLTKSEIEYLEIYIINYLTETKYKLKNFSHGRKN
jgi:hypothetical protein